MQKLMTALALLLLSGFGPAALADVNKTTICHKGDTLSVAGSAVSAHMNHGDTTGACIDESKPDDDNEEGIMAAVVMMRCDAVLGGKVLVVSASSSPEVEGGINPREDCAIVMAELLDAGYSLRSVSSGSAEDGPGKLRLYTDYLLLGRAPVPAPSR